MKELSRIASAVRASTTLAVDSLAKQMKADGLDIVGFGAGEPDFETPENIKEAGIRAIRAGETKYTPVAGIIPLRKAAAARLKEDCGLDYDYSQIVVASGAKHNIFAALMTLVNPGDEVIIPAPYWVSYIEAVRMAGGVPVVVSAQEKLNFKISAEQLESAITEKTKLMFINNPSNPTGMLYDREELQAIADVCVRHDIYIISDEIYYRLVYDNKQFMSFAALGEEVKKRTVLVNGVSKSYAMTGWRIGYSASNPQIAKVMTNYLSHSTSAPSTISQFAALEALSGPQECILTMRDMYKKRRDYIVKRINSMDGISCIRPDGAFYIMVNIEKMVGKTISGTKIKNGDDFALAFLEKGHVAVVSCSGFGAPNFVRLTYAASMENIVEGLNRLEKFIRE